MNTFPRHGFTLIETLVVIALTAVVALTLGFLIQYFYKTNAYVIEQSQAVESARESLTHAMTDLREASYGTDGSYPIAAASTSTITFYASIGSGGSTAVAKVRYYLAGTVLYRGVTLPAGNPSSYAGQPETTTLVVRNIRNTAATPLFTYFDENGAALSAAPAPTSIASVHIQVLTDVNPLRAPNVFTLNGSATLRNIHTVPIP
jgi:prepilin-type N-terminal cleavage/methylation domain-containing protein